MCYIVFFVRHILRLIFCNTCKSNLYNYQFMPSGHSATMEDEKVCVQT